MPKTDEQTRRAYRVLDFIEAHPKKHDQTMWVNVTGRDVLPEAVDDCGTTGCVAGWTVLLEGLTIYHYDRVHNSSEWAGLGLVPRVAADLLGLDDEEMHDLFYDAADLPEVRKAVTEIFGPRPDGAI